MSENAEASHLSERQLARAEALRLARSVLVARGPFSVGEASPTDMHALAVYILDGGDPWEHHEAVSA